MQLVSEKRGTYINTTYLSENRLNLHYEMPLASLLTDFYDKLKSVSSGYASLNYDFLGYRPCEVERLDIVVAEEMVDSLATIVYRDAAYEVGRKIVDALKETLPRQMFEIKIQAVLGYQDTGKQKGGKVIASSRVAPFRKDVVGYLYGGDVSRKIKLLEKQKKGKKKMKALGRGRVDIPPEAYLSVLKR
jgi:GTP-binding protein LepA